MGGQVGKSAGRERRRRKDPFSYGVPAVECFFCFVWVFRTRWGKKKRGRGEKEAEKFLLSLSLLFSFLSQPKSTITWPVVDGLDVGDVSLVDDDLFFFFFFRWRTR